MGCANGHLAESMVAWSAERGIRLRVDGVTHPAQVPGRPHPPTAWIQLP